MSEHTCWQPAAFKASNCNRCISKEGNNTMQLYRLNRLFHRSSGRCLDVAVDHGLFGESAFVVGIENMISAVEVLVSASPDAIQLTPGQASLLQERPGREKPALILRVDVANVYGSPLEPYLFSLHFPNAVEQAIRLDAACVVTNLLHLPGRPEIRKECIASVMELRRQCDQYAMPLMVEPLVMQDNALNGGYQVDANTKKICALVRQARELGADLIKADPTDQVGEYHAVVEAAGGAPVLVRGGGKVDDDELFRRTEGLLEQGAVGIVYGRNIIQHERPAAMTRALMAMLHEGRTAAEASTMMTETECALGE